MSIEIGQDKESITKRIAKLAPEKRALLDKLLADEGVDAVGLPVIPRRRESDALPLSFAQQRLWFLDRWEPGNPVYNIPLAMRLEGQLNVAALQQSLNEIIKRHEALRTTFTTADGQPVQVVSNGLEMKVEITDLRHLPYNQREKEAQRLAAAEAKRPFDLEEGPLVRASLIRLDASEYVFLFNVHHIVFDGWSLDVFERELKAHYKAFSTGAPCPLPPLPVQYADFALWQKQQMAGDVLKAELAYWKQQLAGNLPILELPTDRPRPAVQTFRGDTHTFLLPNDLTESLVALSQQEGVSFFMTMLAAFNILLFRYTEKDDLIVGTPVANRSRTEIEGLIGFFVNTLVLRSDMSGNPRFLDLLARVRKVALGAYDHQDLPFEKLVEELQSHRDLSRSPLYQVMFGLQNTPRPTLELPGLRLSRMKIDYGTAMFDLSLFLWKDPEGLSGIFEYNTDLFDAETIRRMTDNYCTLLKGIVTHPEQRLNDLPFIAESERQQLLVAWNENEREYSLELCLHQLFEAQVQRTPDAIALTVEHQHLTYQALNARVNQLARYLQKLGVGTETLVGVCVERNVDMVVALLATLKAGGAYVPLDPAYPKERLAFIMEDTKAPVLLTQQRLLHDLLDGMEANHNNGHAQYQAIYLDSDWQEIAKENCANPVSSVCAENLAYVIYTSGSTGKPKGVAIEHRNAATLVHWAEEIFDPEDLAGMLASTSICFDLSVFELFVTLSWGGKVILAENALHLPNLLARDDVTLINTVPSAISGLVRQKGIPASVRTVNLAGEPLRPELVKAIYAQDTIKQVFDLYGPSEDTTYSTFTQRSATGPYTVGRPIANTKAYLVSRKNDAQPVPLGVPGELLLSGAGLARGYLNRPELTATKFAPHPFSDCTGKRLYKTGDLARYYPDGNLEFLGRIDHQVKIRGYRIELGEIETVLMEHSAVKGCVTVMKEGTDAIKRLVSYVVATSEPIPSITELRSHLLQKLPDYMAPHFFVFLNALPMTPNGKIDRRALPSPDAHLPELERSFVAPRTPIEKKLADIWARTLGLDQVGVDDNFFQLGGDSILSMQIISRAKDEGIQLTLKLIFSNQTIADLAVVAETIDAITADQGVVTGAVPLTPIQHWFFEQQLTDPHHFNQALLLDVCQPLHPDSLKQAIKYLIFHHDALRLRFVLNKTGWQQTNELPDDSIPFSVMDLSNLSDGQQRETIEQKAVELQSSLSLSGRPLLRIAYFDLGTHRPHRLLIIVHHLAVDGVSWRILLEDLQMALSQLEQGETIQLPPKTTSFKAWAQQLRQFAQSDALEREFDYWLSFSGRHIRTLPRDHAAGPNTVASTDTIKSKLSAEETTALLQEIPKAYNTQINDLLLTALVRGFSDWTGESSLLLDLEGHGREEIIEGVDLSRTVGWFTSIFPVLLALKKDCGVSDALKSIKEQLRRIPNRGIGYGLLLHLSNNEDVVSKLQRLPQPEMSFNFLGQTNRLFSASSLFKMSRESTGPVYSPRGERLHLIEINGHIDEECLQFVWIYSKHFHQRNTIKSLAQGVTDSLKSLIAHCQSPDVGGYTPSDFSLANMNQTQLDRLLKKKMARKT